MIDQDHVLCSSYREFEKEVEQLNLDVFSISKGEPVKSLRLTRKHNITRNDPFFAIEAFENLVDFHSIALPETYASY